MRVRLTSKIEQTDHGPGEGGGEDFVPGCADAEDHDDALDQGTYGFGVVGEQVRHGLLQHDAPEQGAGEDEDLLLLAGDRSGVLNRADDNAIGEEGAGEAGGNAGQGAEIRAGGEGSGDPPGDDGGDHHDGAVRQV